MTRIGVFALQGDFDAHREKLSKLGADTLLVRRAEELAAVHGLVLPGGESSAMLRLMSEELRLALRDFLGQRHPVLSTCAGTILLARGVSNPAQFSFGAVDIDVERNGYGRQLESFIDEDVTLTADGQRALEPYLEGRPLEGVFIRAPIIRRAGPSVRILAVSKGHPVLVDDGAIINATFHPELGLSESALHRYFLQRCSVTGIPDPGRRESFA